MKYNNTFRHHFTRVIRATCSYERLTEFYLSIANTARDIKLAITKRINSYMVTFELIVTY